MLSSKTQIPTKQCLLGLPQLSSSHNTQINDEIAGFRVQIECNPRYNIFGISIPPGLKTRDTLEMCISKMVALTPPSNDNMRFHLVLFLQILILIS